MPALSMTSHPALAEQETGFVKGETRYDLPNATDRLLKVTENDGPLSGLGNRLAQKGLFLRATLDNEAAGNPIGGRRRGIASEPYLTIGGDVDFGKVFGWRGTYAHFTMVALRSDSLTYTTIGGGAEVQENSVPFDIYRIMDMTLEQKISIFAPDDLDLLAGRTGVLPHFAANQYDCTFMNHVLCGSLYGFTQSTGTAVAPAASWGGRARLAIGSDHYVQFGGFANDPGTLDPHVQFLDVGTAQVIGTNWLVEVGRQRGPSHTLHPYHIRLGFSYLDAPRKDVLLNTDGLPLYSAGGEPKEHRGETAIYLTMDKMLVHRSAKSARGLAGFTSIYYNLGGNDVIQWTAKAGLVKTGTFVGRDADTLGIGVGVIRYTDKEIDYLNGLQRAAGGAGHVHPIEAVVELNYGHQIAPGVTIRPNLQYVLNPAPRYSSDSPRNISSALVIGLQFFAKIEKLLGLPSLGP